MHHETELSRIAPGCKVWRHGGAIPPWVKSAISGAVADNGTFLINTSLGRQRVHRGHVVVEQAGRIFSCPASEAQQIILEGQKTEKLTGATSLIGPGKSLRHAVPTKPRKVNRVSDKARRAYPAVKGSPPSIEWISVNELLVDQSYQRSIESISSTRIIATIAARWDWRLCMPLAVSRRDGGKYVIDGQHRLAAAKKRGDILHLPCCVATYDSPADEAAMFVAANRVRRAINRLDDFHAALVAGDEDAVQVSEVVNLAGLRVSRKPGGKSDRPGEVAFTSTIQGSIDKFGEEAAAVALGLIADAFTAQPLTGTAALFSALARMIAEGSDPQALAVTLKSRSISEWGDFAKGIYGSEARAVAMHQALASAGLASPKG